MMASGQPLCDTRCGAWERSQGRPALQCIGERFERLKTEAKSLRCARAPATIHAVAADLSAGALLTGRKPRTASENFDGENVRAAAEAARKEQAAVCFVGHFMGLHTLYSLAHSIECSDWHSY